MAEPELTVRVLRELFRNLYAWRAVYESDGVEEVADHEGIAWSIWDIEFLFDQIDTLPLQQGRAIQLCLIQNIRERDAAVMMGVSATNPVMSYATLGLEKLVASANGGALRRSRNEREAS